MRPSIPVYVPVLLLVHLCARPAVAQDPNGDSYFQYQWPLHNTGQTYPQGCTTNCDSGTVDADIDWAETYDAGIRGDGIVIAIGAPRLTPTVECDHPDLVGQLWVNPNEVIDGSDNDGNGVIDDINGANFGASPDDGDVCASLSGGPDHDTDVARLMVGAVDGFEAVGVAPNAKLMLLLWDGAQNNKDFYNKALAYADAHGARMIVVPYEGVPETADPDYPITSTTECNSYSNGNGVNRSNKLAGSDALVFWGHSDAFPGCNPSTVGLNWSRDHDGAVGPINSFNDFTSPGDRGWLKSVQLSWALPIAGGVAALALHASAGLPTRDDLKRRLENSADKVGPAAYVPPPPDPNGYNTQYGYGRLNAFTAAQQGDLDLDGVDADGNLSGTIGDATCATGQSASCDDNCPILGNASQTDADADTFGDVCDNCPGQGNSGQEDTGGIGAPDPDGIGNACQCGDSSGDGTVDARDVTATQLCDTSLGVCRPTCDADSGADCDADDIPPVESALGGGPAPSCVIL